MYYKMTVLHINFVVFMWSTYMAKALFKQSINIFIKDLFIIIIIMNSMPFFSSPAHIISFCLTTLLSWD